MIDKKSVLPPALLALTLWSVCATAVAANLRVGAARVDITPPADATNPPTGKYEHEHLYVRAIVLDYGSARAVLIGADQAGLPEIVWTTASKQIANEVDCPVPNIIMSATRLHLPGVKLATETGMRGDRHRRRSQKSSDRERQVANEFELA